MYCELCDAIIRLKCCARIFTFLSKNEPYRSILYNDLIRRTASVFVCGGGGGMALAYSVKLIPGRSEPRADSEGRIGDSAHTPRISKIWFFCNDKICRKTPG